jgi:hypothetical protein
MKKKNLRRDFHQCAEDGVWWEPDGCPAVPAGWIRELVAIGRIPATDEFPVGQLPLPVGRWFGPAGCDQTARRFQSRPP